MQNNKLPKQDRILQYDLKHAISSKPLIGLWRLLTGYQLEYVAATILIGLSAFSKTITYLLLQFFIDNYLITQTSPYPVILIPLGFVGLAILQGAFTFFSGKFAAEAAEGSTRRLRNYLFDHIQHLTFTYHSETDTGELIQRCTSDVDALRRFYNDQAIGIGRIFLLFVINFA